MPRHPRHVNRAGGTPIPPPRDVDPVIRAKMQRVRSRDTKPELALRRELHRRGLRYVVQRAVFPDRRRVDIVFSKARIAIFVDGCFWHSCPEHLRMPASNVAWWTAKLKRTTDRDRQTDQDLRAAGWTVVRAWEHEAPRAAADRIEVLVRGTPSGSIRGAPNGLSTASITPPKPPRQRPPQQAPSQTASPTALTFSSTRERLRLPRIGTTASAMTQASATCASVTPCLRAIKRPVRRRSLVARVVSCLTVWSLRS